MLKKLVDSNKERIDYYFKRVNYIWNEEMGDHCMEPTLGRDENNKYPRIQLKYEDGGWGKFGFYMSHIAWILENGMDIPQGKDISHLCHNKKCVNHKHLIVESHTENILRSVDRGNDSFTYRKYSNGQIKRVKEYLSKTGLTNKRITELTGVHRSMVSKIKNGNAWNR